MDQSEPNNSAFGIKLEVFMRYPTLEDTGARREFTDVFGGLAVDAVPVTSGWYGETRKRLSEWAWTANATNDAYPAASTRSRRRFNECPGNPRGFAIYEDQNGNVNTVVVGTSGGHSVPYVNGVIPTGLEWYFRLAVYEKHVVPLGQRIYFLRSDSRDADKAQYAFDQGAVSHFDLDVTFNSSASAFSAGGVRFYPCDEDGRKMLTWYGEKPPNYNSAQITDDVAGLYWVDNSKDDGQLKKYSTVLADWIPVSQAYVKISVRTSIATADAFSGLKANDFVVISGAAAGDHSGAGNPGDPKRKSYNDRAIGSLNTSGTAGKKIVAKGEDDGLYPYIIVESTDIPAVNGLSYVGQDTTSALVISRTVPVLKYVCAGENRIWGCVDSTNEIRACALGDPANWNAYEGISTDSYAVTVGGERGAFTGAAFAFGGPLFFKENAVIRIYGTAPSNYRLQAVTAPGVAAGSAKSVAVVGGYVYYLSPGGVRCYDGSTVRDIGAALGKTKYKNGVGAGTSSKYYLACQDEADAWHLFVYDIKLGTWIREDALHARFAAAIGDTVTFIEQTGNTDAYGYVRLTSNRTDAPIRDAVTAPTPDHTEEGAFDWEYITPPIGYSSPDNKYISRFNLRLKMDAGARLDVYVRYDGVEAWEHRTSVTSFGAKSFTIPIRPRRCDHMQIRLAGRGNTVIYSLAKIYENGSDVVR